MQLNDATLKYLRKQYTQKHRHYHTIRHVNDLMRTIYDHEELFANPTSAYLAAWFHDVIYEIGEGYKYNEERSAKALLHWIEDQHPEFYNSEEGQKAVKLAVLMIGATHGHGFDTIRPTVKLSEEEWNDIALFLDADLRILSRPQTVLLEFEENIRKEFSIYDDLVYNQGRKQVLESFLLRPKLYLSEMGKPWESKARKNLELLIKRLS